MDTIESLQARVKELEAALIRVRNLTEAAVSVSKMDYASKDNQLRTMSTYAESALAKAAAALGEAVKTGDVIHATTRAVLDDPSTAYIAAVLGLKIYDKVVADDDIQEGDHYVYQGTVGILRRIKNGMAVVDWNGAEIEVDPNGLEVADDED